MSAARAARRVGKAAVADRVDELTQRVFHAMSACEVLRESCLNDDKDLRTGGAIGVVVRELKSIAEDLFDVADEVRP